MHQSGADNQASIAAPLIAPEPPSPNAESSTESPPAHPRVVDSAGPSFVGLADGSLRMLDPAWPKVDALSWWITAAIAFVAGAIGLLITSLTDEVDGPIMAVIISIWAALIGLLALGAWRWPGLAYRHARYIVSPHGLEIRRGVIWRSVTNVPRSRIQHTDVTQGPIMRRYNLATLVIHTAGTHYAIVTLAGLSHETAMQLRDFLIRGGDLRADADAV